MKSLLFAAAASLALAMPVHAQSADQEVRQLKRNDTLDPASGKAYFFYDTIENKYDIFFLRSLTGEELERFDANRAEALAERRAKLREKRDGAPGVSDEELVPDAGFSFVDPDIRNLVRLDSGRVYEKGDESRTYVVEVPPGEYTIYAAGIDGFTSGTCMCMGTVRFEVGSGQIMDLGTILVAPENGKTDISELAPFEAPEYIRRKALPFVMSVRPASAGDAAPALFADEETIAAQYSAAGPIPNFLGMLINRMAPVAGVLAYDRDIPVDLRALQAASDEAVAAAAKLAEAQEELAEAAESLGDAADALEAAAEAIDVAPAPGASSISAEDVADAGKE